jgi:uncharacterized protein (DUF2342 family)
MAYARRTTVKPERTRGQIEALLKKAGAAHFGYTSGPGRAQIAFASADRRIKFVIPIPTKGSKAAIESEERRRWRSLLLSIKGKLVGIEDGVETFEEAFLAHVVTESGMTVMEAVRKMQAEAGPLLLGSVGSRED